MKEQAANTIPAHTNPKQPALSVLNIKRYNMAAYLDKQFGRDIENFKKSGRIQSGFANLDAITNLYPGLYVLGAISSLGKTTFSHQMADQMAETGNHILFFSLEQSVLELASKSIARTLQERIQKMVCPHCRYEGAACLTHALYPQSTNTKLFLIGSPLSNAVLRRQ